MTQTSIFQVDVNGKLIIPQYATLVQLTPGVYGFVLPSIPLDPNTILSDLSQSQKLSSINYCL